MPFSFLSLLALFRTPCLKEITFFPVGPFCEASPSTHLPKTQPLQVRFPLLQRVALRRQKERFFGVDNCLRGGWGGQPEERQKGCAKKGGNRRTEPSVQ